MEAKVAEVRAELDKEEINTARLRELTDSLSTSLQKVGEAAYQSAAETGEGMPGAEPETGSAEDSSEGDVVEGEFEDI